ncbi:cobalt-precorrin-6y C15-methyltransferase [Klebsiella pneumoniae]|uniref:Cobalt-precorrin-6y C15-methyltransferase n=1 Tax=Klebsiella pneumoniae TaxID=573 RepID=A0A2X3CRX4_KLEPN|nr:cobalt-precorrin-6y C15-methyltransferase [Klebsiella pneumoniae]
MKDELFLRGAQVPMTKEAVRALALAKLELHRARHLIDIGAGTGSVSIEAALQNPALRVTAIERQADALRLLAENRSALAATTSLSWRVLRRWRSPTKPTRSLWGAAAAT